LLGRGRSRGVLTVLGQYIIKEIHTYIGGLWMYGESTVFGTCENYDTRRMGGGGVTGSGVAAAWRIGRSA